MLRELLLKVAVLNQEHGSANQECSFGILLKTYLFAAPACRPNMVFNP